MRPSGQVVKPVKRERGFGTWLLEPGRYVVITVRRPRSEPYEVTIQCIDFVSQGERYVIAEASLYTMSFDRNDLVEWARSACP
jgi:hypothetical protein